MMNLVMNYYFCFCYFYDYSPFNFDCHSCNMEIYQFIVINPLGYCHVFKNHLKFDFSYFYYQCSCYSF